VVDLRNAVRLVGGARNYVFKAASKNDKTRWLDTLKEAVDALNKSGRPQPAVAAPAAAEGLLAPDAAAGGKAKSRGGLLNAKRRISKVLTATLSGSGLSSPSSPRTPNPFSPSLLSPRASLATPFDGPQERQQDHRVGHSRRLTPTLSPGRWLGVRFQTMRTTEGASRASRPVASCAAPAGYVPAGLSQASYRHDDDYLTNPLPPVARECSYQSALSQVTSSHADDDEDEGDASSDGGAASDHEDGVAGRRLRTGLATRPSAAETAAMEWLVDHIDTLDVAMAHRQFDDAVDRVLEVRAFLANHPDLASQRHVRAALDQRTSALADRICADLRSPTVLSRGLLRQTVKQLLALGLQDRVRERYRSSG